MRAHLAVTLIVLFATSTGAIAVNKCTDAAGKVTLTDKPCQSTEQRERVEITESSGGFRPEQPPLRLEPVQPTRLPTTPVTASASPRVQIGYTQAELECANAKREHLFKASSKLAKREEVEGAFLRSVAACEGTERSREELARLQQREAQRRTEAMASAQQQRDATLSAVPGMVVFNCDGGGCNTSLGRLSGDPRSTMRGPNGITCQRVGPQLHCN